MHPLQHLLCNAAVTSWACNFARASRVVWYHPIAHMTPVPCHKHWKLSMQSLKQYLLSSLWVSASRCLSCFDIEYVSPQYRNLLHGNVLSCECSGVTTLAQFNECFTAGSPLPADGDGLVAAINTPGLTNTGRACSSDQGILCFSHPYI